MSLKTYRSPIAAALTLLVMGGAGCAMDLHDPFGDSVVANSPSTSTIVKTPGPLNGKNEVEASYMQTVCRFLTDGWRVDELAQASAGANIELTQEQRGNLMVEAVFYLCPDFKDDILRHLRRR